ncbi:protein ENHANCED DISEASE RESISTANCE 4 [Neltuma alba]|uniref:protein ENHANCED DISEASE RESISTANCE 4 n=1 Tax=Neltuma alba TaxID=207710 RepID=UPI0010A3E3C1|nr:protein ENHANCED DISEASE RESISTANCE 4-like [Prosopis alba]
MTESSGMRLVRCPKCENLLPELSDYSVYQCGGCGAVLRAEYEGYGNESMLEKPDVENIGKDYAKSDNLLDKEVVGSSDPSDTKVGSNSGSSRYNNTRNFEKEHDEREISLNHSIHTEAKELFAVGLHVNRSKDKVVNLVESDQEGPVSQISTDKGSKFSGRMSDWQNGERAEIWRRSQADIEGVRFSTSNYPDEATSSSYSGFPYSHGQPWRNQREFDNANRVQNLEQDRAELLRKLDELKNQLGQPSDMANNPKEEVHVDERMIPPDPYGGSSNAWLPGRLSELNGTSRQFFRPDNHPVGPSNFSYHHRPFAYANDHQMAMPSFHPSMRNADSFPAYVDPFAPQIHRKNLHQLPHQIPQQPFHPYYPRHFVDTNPDLYEPYAHNTMLHPPSCSCFNCYESRRRVPAPRPPTKPINSRFPETAIPNDHISYRYKVPRAYGSHAHNFRSTTRPMNFLERHPPSRWSGEFNSEMAEYFRSRFQKVVLAGGSHHCRPIAGGSPFITCFNCFELLQLPKKALVMTKNCPQNVRCGACSSEISLSVIDKKLIISPHTEIKGTSTSVDDSSDEFANSCESHSHGHLKSNGANFSSDDYSGYDFHSVDKEPVLLAADPSLNSGKSQETPSFHSSSPEVMIDPCEVIQSIQQPTMDSLSSPPAGSALKDYFDYSNNNHAVTQFEKGNRSSRLEQEKVKVDKIKTRQNSLKDVVLATEMDIHDYGNTGVSEESSDVSRKHDQPKANKGGDSFIANIIKKGFRDFSRSHDERERSNVTVNGQPIPSSVIKKAEKLAGPIQPGSYWYDFRAGFWGVMGGPCLGIIPPHIEEFSYPMPENCAGGNTGVFVNGRELHQKDLNLLAGRGLPTERDRSYIIEISGRVLDEDTGGELDCLGKLAPTVEKVKHGFGMKPPRAAS